MYVYYLTIDSVFFTEQEAVDYLIEKGAYDKQEITKVASAGNFKVAKFRIKDLKNTYFGEGDQTEDSTFFIEGIGDLRLKHWKGSKNYQ